MAFDPTATRSGAEFSTNPYYTGAWLCYINGHAVPIQGWDVTSGVWMIPQFQIMMVPDVTLMRLGYEDLAEVSIWYYDQWLDPEHPDWRMVCDGEVVGWQFQHIEGARVMSFDCIAHIHVFQQLFFYFMSNVDDVVAAEDPSLKASGFATAGLSYPTALFHKGLSLTGAEASALNDRNGTTQEAAGNDQIKAPYEFVYNVIRGIISKEVPDEKRSLPMMNFFARWVRKCRFHNRFVRLPILEDGSVLAARKGVFPIFEAARNDQALLAMERHTASEYANAGPVYDLLEHVLKLVYMEISMNPSPACVQVTLDPFEDGKIIGLLDDNTALNDIRAPVEPATIPTDRLDITDDDRALARREIELGRELTPADVEVQSRAATLAAIRNMREHRPEGDIFGTSDQGEESELAWARSMLDGRMDPSDRTATELRNEIRLANADHRDRAFGHYQNTRRRAGGRAAALLADDVGAVSETRDISSYDVRIAQEVVRTGLLPTPATEGQSGYSAGMINHYRETLRIAGMTAPQLAAIQLSLGNVESSSATSRPTTVAQAIQAERAQAEQRRLNLEALAQREAQDRHDSRPLREGVASTAPVRLAQYCVKPQIKFGEPPAFNVVFPSMMTGWSLNEDYKAQPTRIYVNDSVMTRMLRAQGTNRELMMHALTVGYPAEAQAVMHHRLTAPNGMTIEGVHETGKNLLIWPEEYHAGPKVGRQELPGWFQTMLQWRNGQTTTTLTDLNAPQAPTDPTTPANTLPHPQQRRGGAITSRPPVSTDFLPDSWEPTAEVERLANATPQVVYNGTEFEEQGGTWSPGHALRPSPFLSQLVRDLRQLFPGHFTEAGLERPGNRNNLHSVGRATDLMIPMVNGRIDHAKGDAIAAWLATHAAEVGIQYFIWATASWNANNSAGYRRQPYTLRNAQGRLRSDNDLHRNHIHLELNVAGSRGETPYFQARRDTRQVVREPATRIVERPVPGQQPVLPSSGLITGTVTPGVSEAVRTEVNPVAVEDEESFNKLFYLYTQYKFFEDRYNARVAGAQLKYNPYMVAGYPGMLFDSIRTSFHMVGYVQRLSHSARVGPQGSMSTSVSYTCTRTLPEFMADVKRDAELFGRRVTSAPAELIPEIRDTLQNHEQASIYYGLMFYGSRLERPAGMGKPAAFNFMDAVGMQRGNNIVPIEINEFTVERRAVDFSGATNPALNGPTDADIAAARQAVTTARTALTDFNRRYDASVPWWDRGLVPGVSAAPSTTPRPNGPQGLEQKRLIRAISAAEAHVQELITASEAASRARLQTEPVIQTTSTRVETNIEPNDELSPLPGVYTKAFEEYHTAMRLASRPICSLTQYIRFLHGGETLGALIQQQIVEGPVDTFAYATVIGRDVNGSGSEARGLSERKSATYYRRIFKLRQGPGAEPNAQQRGFTDPPFAPTAVTSGVAPDYPQTRADWDSALIAYAEKIRKIRLDR